jgi:oxalate decarboxylase/phosphoglucose isomerase-like protein (cupin superfamily)
MSSSSHCKPAVPAAPPPVIQVIQIEKQPWYEADDKALAREIASPRNSQAQALRIADIIIPAGVAVKPHYHKVIEEIYYVTAGSGIMMLTGARPASVSATPS